jgi:hypothetical protein
MAIVQIQEWLNSVTKDYQVGVELLRQHNPTHPRLFIFGLTECPAHLRWLTDALKELVNSGSHASGSKLTSKPLPNPNGAIDLKTHSKTAQESTSTTPNFPWKFRDVFDKLSENLRDEYVLRIKTLYNTRREVHGGFDPKKGTEHNRQISLRLSEIENLLDDYFNRVRNYIDHGIEENRGLFAQYLLVERRVITHREYISKNSKHDQKKQRIEERLEQLAADQILLQKIKDQLYEIT